MIQRLSAVLPNAMAFMDSQFSRNDIKQLSTVEPRYQRIEHVLETSNLGNVRENGGLIDSQIEWMARHLTFKVEHT